MKNILKSVCVILGTVIGAGFSSGKEVQLFFFQYGTKGLIGLTIASAIIGIVVYRVLMDMRKIDANNYEEYLEKVKCKKTVRKILSITINIFLIISFYIMIAGFCAFFKQEYGVQTIITAIIVSIICYITFMKKIEGITKINLMIIPILITIIILIGTKSIINGDNVINQTVLTTKSWLIASIEYASYNSILLIPILIELKQYTYKKEKEISLTIFLIFCFLAVMIYMILLQGNSTVFQAELPLIQIMQQHGEIYKIIYGLTIVCAIYTTSISAGYGFLKNVSKKRYNEVCMVMCLIAPLVSRLGFSYLINLMYPIFGILGMVQLLYLIFYRKLEKKLKN